MRINLAAPILALCFGPAFGCGGASNSGAASDPTPPATDTTQSDTNAATGGDEETGRPDPNGEGPAEFPIGRKIRRMTADQFARSLHVATGQQWPGFAKFAAALGQADFAEITAHDRSLSVTFDKFIHDAALSTCRAAITNDLETGDTVILRHSTLMGDDTALRANLAYLMLRFLAVDVPTNDERLDPWLAVLNAPSQLKLSEDEIRRERWVAVCVGLATHVDFITY